MQPKLIDVFVLRKKLTGGLWPSDAKPNIYYKLGTARSVATQTQRRYARYGGRSEDFEFDVLRCALTEVAVA